MKKRQDPKIAIRDQIVDALRALPEDATWKLPWRRLVIPMNASTGRSYSGLNILTLTVRAMSLGVSGGAWLTYKQAKALGGSVRKGEKGTRGIYYRTVTKNEGTDDEETFPMLKSFVLFHTSQCEGLDAQLVHEMDEKVDGHEDDFVPGEELASLIDVCPVALEVGGDVAGWSPELDRIYMPFQEQFGSLADWWRTYLHELAHATGHVSRLNRTSSVRFGSREYAFEELVAELASAIMSLNFGVSSSPEPGRLDPAHAQDHAAYISSWIRLLEDDPQALFDAWALALGASDWVDGLLAGQEAATEAA